MGEPRILFEACVRVKSSEIQMENRSLDARLWSVGLKMQRGESSDRVYRPKLLGIIPGREEKEETRAKQDHGTCHHMEVGPMPGMRSSLGPGT